MSSAAISPSADILRLVEAGYEVSIRKALLILSNVPYRTADGALARGVLMSDLQTANGTTVHPVENHQVWFGGSMPFDANGNSLEPVLGPAHQPYDPLPDIHVDFHLSHKVDGRSYRDYFEKLSRYAEVLERGAKSIDPDATAKTFAVDGVVQDYGVFNYPDTAAARAGIVDFNERLAMERVAIVGLGGTGSYILDFIAKTPIVEIHTFDGDALEDHNAYRAPGAASGDDLAGGQFKVTYYHEIYSRMRSGLVPHEFFITAENVDELRQMNYVFLAMDGGPDEQAVAEKLIEWGIPFTSVGMGVTRREGGLTAMLRTTSSTPADPADPARLGVTAKDPENDYAKGIQIAELNAWNAIQAVVAWKKFCGFYVNESNERRSSVLVHRNKIILA
ncbi:MAG: ThiF family adenylyltransferase [Solirubrobacterales bacterium]